MIEGNAAPLKNLQQVETRLRTLRGRKAGLQQQLGTLGISSSRVSSGNITSSLAVVAPISGTVSTVQAQIGSNIDPSTPLAEIVNNSRLHVDLFVYEKDYQRLALLFLAVACHSISSDSSCFPALSLCKKLYLTDSLSFNCRNSRYNPFMT